MSKPKKDSEFLHCKIGKKISEDVVKFYEKSGLTKTTAVERALRFYTEHYNKTCKV